METNHGLNVALPACFAHTPVVRQRGYRELPRGWLDATPLKREPICAETHSGHQIHILIPAMVGVTGVATGLGAPRSRVMFPHPPVVVEISALNLVGGGRYPPNEIRRKALPGFGPSCHVPSR